MDPTLNLSEFVEKTSLGILIQFENDCKRQQNRLEEFLGKQSQLLSSIDRELVKFRTLESLQLEDMMYLLKTCQIRLQTIKERMRKASFKSSKLKSRSLKIQQMKQKQALERELEREAQLTREQDMVAKSPSFNLNSHSTLHSPS